MYNTCACQLTLCIDGHAFTISEVVGINEINRDMSTSQSILK